MHFLNFHNQENHKRYIGLSKLKIMDSNSNNFLYGLEIVQWFMMCLLRIWFWSDNIFKKLNLKIYIRYMAFVRFFYEFLNNLKTGFFSKVHKIIEKNEFGLFLCTHVRKGDFHWALDQMKKCSKNWWETFVFNVNT